MSKEHAAVVIDYYTDVLCVWAWIAQPRLEELHRQYGQTLAIRHHCVDIFGDSHNKILQQWGARDGFEKFASHVSTSAAPFEHCKLHPGIWLQTRPRSSLQAHLLLKAVQLNCDDSAVEKMARRIREAFFCESRDIGDLDLLLEMATAEQLDTPALQRSIRDGSAISALSADLRSAGEQGVKGSPTWVLNAGRQVLYGNIGYRILSANIDELLKRPAAEASWC